ncbi:MAG TPA: site-specific DNA-methyltransferase [Synechococcus sp. UBA8638]|uniref:DNA-methyltransferase n=1 Tax=Candidatus Synechococcus spongiarum TaxID=431041 RepID=UPI0009B81937|nr:site-specific DNA-methyltransferase [Candidatus Synechococcus spongiarum]HBP53710.1 site-specific DNA-methyltransferase [Synechococcus sp. UBA8638]
MTAARVPADQTLQVRARVNKWISATFPESRKHISHALADMDANGVHRVELMLKRNGHVTSLGHVQADATQVSPQTGHVDDIAQRLQQALQTIGATDAAREPVRGPLHDFRFGDGIVAASELPDLSVDLLLTDPPYSISKAYICETQAPRRLRTNGSDFIMPKGYFGQWDEEFPQPEEWTSIIIPKVRGWVVIFCAQAQIGEYCDILNAHKLSAVGTMVWHKTNPVPFNHKYKPINAWEAIVIGKRPGTKFNGKTVHNVFECKSPSPQERVHPTQKPLDLIAKFIGLFSSKGAVVLDPFAGSATTLIAAANLGRCALGYENDPSTL